EFTLKGHQMRYFPGMREIEYQMFAEDPTHAPRIDYSWSYAPEMLDPDPKKTTLTEGKAVRKATTNGNAYPGWVLRLSELGVVSPDVSASYHVSARFFHITRRSILLAWLQKERTIQTVWTVERSV